MTDWRKVIHPQAAKRRANKLQFGPGYLGTGQQRVPTVPLSQFTRRLTNIPLQGGQAQGVIGGWAAASGSATSPAAGTVLASTTVNGTGTQVIGWSVTIAGTAGSTDEDNFELRRGSTVLATSVNSGAAGTYPQTPVSATVSNGETLSVVNIRAATSGAQYTAGIPVNSVPLTLQVAPQAVGTIWYPAQIAVYTSVGPLDTSVANIYLGPALAVNTLVSTVYSGNGVSGNVPAQITPGQSVIAQWTGGTPGSTAAVNVTGTMNAIAAWGW